MKGLLVLSALCAFAALASADDGCFPMTRAWGNGPGNMTREQWWCGNDKLHGFLGFSYPVEDDGCDDYSYDGFLKDFQRMRHDYNATFVRTYLPACMDSGFWEKIISAARDAQLGLIPMVFWDWGQNDDVMYKAENALMQALTNSDVASAAPYVVYAVAFGDELGEQDQYWFNDMKDYKSKLSPLGIGISVSDDWDRGTYRTGNGGELNDFGKQVNDLSDLTQVHVQPYYHADQASDAYHMWGYYQNQLQYIAQNNKQPIFVSQTNWASYQGGDHNRGMDDWADNMDNFQEYWNTINNNCALFKQLNIGWFFHSWYGEGAFDLLNDDGSAKMNFKPNFC